MSAPLLSNLPPAKEAEVNQALDDLRDIANRLRWHERDVLLFRVSPSTVVTTRTAGDFGVREVDGLMRMLMLQREIMVARAEDA